MKQTVRIAGGINEFFGTLDENLKYFESSLKVRTHLKDHDLEIEGDPEQVERAARIVDAYNQRVLEGRIPNSQEVKALLHVAADEPAGDSSRGFFAHANARAGQEERRPEEPEPEALYRGARNARHGVRHRARGHRERRTWPWPWLFPRCSPSR